jgi:hypothetical protein
MSPDISVEEWDDVLGVNLRGNFLTIQACLAPMQHQRYGWIVRLVVVCDNDEDEEPVADETPSPDIMISIELRHGRTVRPPSRLPCGKIRHLVAAMESA